MSSIFPELPNNNVVFSLCIANWEEWLLFFLEGVEETAEEAVRTTTQILEIFAQDRARIESLGGPAGNALRVHSLLQKNPVVSAAAAANELSLTAPTVEARLIIYKKSAWCARRPAKGATVFSFTVVISMFFRKIRTKHFQARELPLLNYEYKTILSPALVAHKSIMRWLSLPVHNPRPRVIQCNLRQLKCRLGRELRRWTIDPPLFFLIHINQNHSAVFLRLVSNFSAFYPQNRVLI